MLTGALFWGLSADMVGRRYAFNLSLFICSVAAIIAGAMPNWAGLGVFVALVGFGAGGNLIMDTTVFLEYLPGDKQWVLTFLACWWGLGQAVTGFIAWGFLGEFSHWFYAIAVAVLKCVYMLTCVFSLCEQHRRSGIVHLQRSVRGETTWAGAVSLASNFRRPH